MPRGRLSTAQNVPCSINWRACICKCAQYASGPAAHASCTLTHCWRIAGAAPPLALPFSWMARAWIVSKLTVCQFGWFISGSAWRTGRCALDAGSIRLAGRQYVRCQWAPQIWAGFQKEFHFFTVIHGQEPWEDRCDPLGVCPCGLARAAPLQANLFALERCRSVWYGSGCNSQE